MNTKIEAEADLDINDIEERWEEAIKPCYDNTEGWRRAGVFAVKYVPILIKEIRKLRKRRNRQVAKQ